MFEPASGQRKVSISDFVSSRANVTSLPISNPERLEDSKKSKNTQEQQGIASILEKAEALAKIYGGKCLSQTSLSNCKGRNSIRFNCINAHNFYLSEDKIQSCDIPKLTASWKNARKDLKSY
jgi:hypothetical protein